MFAEKIGEIAASWSQAEVNLNCLFAVLMGTTPDEAAKELRKYRTADQSTRGARKLAPECFAGADLDTVRQILDRLDAVRLRRNRIQHDVWALKPSDGHRLFAIHAKDYLDLATRMVAVDDAEDRARAELAIEALMTFAGNVSCGYTIEELASIDAEINLVSMSLLQVTLQQIQAAPRKE